MSQYDDIGPVKPSGRLVTCGVIFIIIVALVIGAVTWNSWGPALIANLNQPKPNVTQPAPTTSSGTQPGQPSEQLAVPSSPAEKQTIRACFVNFGPYLPIVLIPEMKNPAYNLELVPLNFYTKPAEELTEADFINYAGESDQIAMLTSGECDILLTTVDVLSKHPGMGKQIWVIGQSDGADKTVAWNIGVSPECKGKPINIFNDLAGCRFAVAEDSVGYFQALSFLNLANISIDQVKIDTYATPEEAIMACLDGKADVCSGWVPSIEDMIIEGKSKVLVDSKHLKTIYDGVFVSPNADKNKKPAVTEFLADFIRAVNMTKLDGLPESAVKIGAWIYNGVPTNEYTFVFPGSEYDDMVFWLETYSQAGFDNHYVFTANPDLLYKILQTGRDGWAYSGLPLDGGFNPESMVDLSYFQALSSRTDLSSTDEFVNNEFSPFPKPSDTPATRDQLINLPTLVEVVCPNVYFRPGKTEIPKDSLEYAAFLECGAQLQTLLAQSDVQILIIGSAAWPDPATFGQTYAHCGDKSDLDYCSKVAKDRASWALNELIQASHVPGNRIALDYRLGEKTSSQAVLQENRFVTIQVKVGGLE